MARIKLLKRSLYVWPVYVGIVSGVRASCFFHPPRFPSHLYLSPNPLFSPYQSLSTLPLRRSASLLAALPVHRSRPPFSHPPHLSTPNRTIPKITAIIRPPCHAHILKNKITTAALSTKHIIIFRLTLHGAGHVLERNVLDKDAVGGETGGPAVEIVLLDVNAIDGYVGELGGMWVSKNQKGRGERTGLGSLVVSKEEAEDAGLEREKKRGERRGKREERASVGKAA